MIEGIGTDILEIGRITGGMRKQRFLLRIFTEEELQYCANKPAESAAGLFAAKEAAVKAAGIGFNGFWPRDVEITHDIYGKPAVRPKGVFKELCDAKRIVIHISISHTKELAIAVAVAETAEGDWQ